MFISVLTKTTIYRHFSYLHQISSIPLKYITVGEFLENSAKKFHDRDAIISVEQKTRFTYGEALEKCDRLAAGLVNIGLQKGDMVGVWCPNLPEWFIIKFACARAGFILVALNPGYQQSEIEYSINKVGIKSIICPYKVKKQNYYEILNSLANLEKNANRHIKSDTVPSLKSVITISEENLKGTHNFEEIRRCSDQSLIQKIKKNQDMVSPDDPFSVLFSSGTTGKPKAALVSHFSHVNNGMFIGKRMELDKKHHKICMMVPFFHAFGINITTLSAVGHGSTIVIPSAVYDSAKNLSAIKNENCTVLHGTPTMHLDLITEQRKRKEDISPEIAVSGGAPISPQHSKNMMKELNLKMVKSVYGLTESTAMVFFSNPGDDEEKSVTTVGLLGDHTEVKIVDKNGKMVPFGTVGELCVRGYLVMKEYWKDEEKTQAILGKDGWLKTGDLFILNEDGYGKIVGRIKDMIIRGGENIYPKEIEDFLITHPNIAEAYVIGLPHERLGEEVCACVKFTEGKNMSLEEMKKFCQGKIAHFKIPSHFMILDSFPKTTSGKIQKFKLVEKFSKTL